MHNIWLFDLLLCCPSTQCHFEGPFCQVTIILQPISLKLIQRRKHNIATPNSECRDSSALCYIDCCNLPGIRTTSGCVICCCAVLQHSFISKVQSSRLLPESDNNSTGNFFKSYSNTQHWIFCQIYCCLYKQAQSIRIEG